MSRFFGRLIVSRGEVTFWPSGRANDALNVEHAEPIVHRDHLLTVIAGRLLPPWMNSGLVLVGAENSTRVVGVVLLTAWQRRAAVETARMAGFEVSLYRTNFSAGGGIGSTAELERFRRDHT